MLLYTRPSLYHPVIHLSFPRPECETCVYFPGVRKKTSEAHCSFSTIDTAIDLTYCLLLPFLDRLGRFAQPFQRMLLSTAVFLSHFFLSNQGNTCSPLGLIAYTVGIAVPKVEACCCYLVQFVLFSPIRHLLCFDWEM